MTMSSTDHVDIGHCRSNELAAKIVDVGSAAVIPKNRPALSCFTFGEHQHRGKALVGFNVTSREKFGVSMSGIRQPWSSYHGPYSLPNRCGAQIPLGALMR